MARTADSPGDPWPYNPWGPTPLWYSPPQEQLDPVKEYRKFYRYFLMKKTEEKLKRELASDLENLEEGVRENILFAIQYSLEEIMKDEPWFP